MAFPPDSAPSPTTPPTLPFRPGARPQLVGVVGGIASGKSTVAAELAGPGGRVISADALAHAALAAPDLRERLVERFGAAALRPDGSPDRAYLGARAFADPQLRRALESWIHPRVRARIVALMLEAQADRCPRVILDVPLLLENDPEHGLARACDQIVYVATELSAREARAAATRGWASGEVARRESAQLAQPLKRARAQFQIDNHGELAALRAECARVRAELDAALTRS
jgi:dephospho-CoA kinase